MLVAKFQYCFAINKDSHFFKNFYFLINFDSPLNRYDFKGKIFSAGVSMTE